MAATGAGFANRAQAQDTQYWTSQYGNRARLLGGTVIGSVTELSAVYYNPGLLALVDQPELLVAGNVFQYTNINVKNGLDEGVDLSASKLGGVPSLFAGELRFGFLGDHRLSYSFLTRHNFDIRIEKRADLIDLIPDPSIDLFTASISFEQNMNDYWGGLTWAFPLNPRVGVGVTTFVSVRDQRVRREVLVQALADTLGGIALQRRELDFQHWSVLWKVGIGARLDPLRLGLTITTPNVGVFGGGSVGFDETVISQDLDGDGDAASLVISEVQDDLSADYNTPLSIGFGAAYIFGATVVHASAEWFDDVGEFTVVDAEPIAAPGDLEDRDVDLVQELDAVLNFGVGVEQIFSERVEGYVSFRTDFSAADPDSPSNASVSIWDIYHLAGGATFAVAGSEFTLGGIYAFGSEPTSASIDLIPDDVVDDPIVELRQELENTFRRITFILGFTISFE